MRGQGSREGEWVVNRGARGREGGLGAERGISCGRCECLVQGEGNREGELDANRARGLEVGRVVSGPRRDLLVGSMSAWCEGRAAKRASGLRIGPVARGKEGGLGAKRGLLVEDCCLIIQAKGGRGPQLKLGGWYVHSACASIWPESLGHEGFRGGMRVLR